jgi:hypothetical protein
MSVFDVTKGDATVEEIHWNGDSDFNLIQVDNGVTIKDSGSYDIHMNNSPLVQDAIEAENLIKALQKAIDLKWFQGF